MVEEQTPAPAAQPAPVAPVVAPAEAAPTPAPEPVTPVEVAQVNADIEKKDNEALDVLRTEFDTKMQEKIAEIKDGYKVQLDAQIEEVKKSYSKQFDDLNGKIEELTPRKGIVKNPPVSPVTDIPVETQQAGTPVQEQATTKQLIEALDDPAFDRQAADTFLGSLRSKN